MQLQPEKRSADVIERRESDRNPPLVEPTYLWISLDRRFKARMIDESAGGIGILIREGAEFEVGFQVRVEHMGRRRMATVININEREDDQYRIGLSWDDAHAG